MTGRAQPAPQVRARGVQRRLAYATRRRCTQRHAAHSAPLRRVQPHSRRIGAGRTPRPARNAGGSRSAMTASVFAFAPRLASTTALAPPRRAWRGGPASASSRSQRLGQLGLRPHLHGSAAGEERLGNLAEVLHVRPEDDRLAEDGGLEDVVAAGVHQAAADEHDRRHLIELRPARRSCRARRRRRAARRRSASSDRAHRLEALLAGQPLDLAEPLRVPGRHDEQRVAGAQPSRGGTLAARPLPRPAACCRRRSPAAPAAAGR